MLDLIHQQFVAVEDSIYHPLVVPVAFYAVAGLIRDHIGMTHLQQSARVFSALFQNQFKYVRRLGRELPRIISDLSMLKVTEAIDIGRRMITDPTSIGAGFSGPADLMNAPVARDIYLARISPELESKLRFLLTRTHVRFAEPRKYNIMWLKNKFFPSSEKRSVVVDIVRYVVAKFHPPNDILKSEVVQRWQLISFIILSIPPAGDSLFLHAVRNALLWDWIAYNRETDNVMHVGRCFLRT